MRNNNNNNIIIIIIIIIILIIILKKSTQVFMLGKALGHAQAVILRKLMVSGF